MAFKYNHTFFYPSIGFETGIKVIDENGAQQACHYLGRWQAREEVFSIDLTYNFKSSIESRTADNWGAVTVNKNNSLSASYQLFLDTNTLGIFTGFLDVGQTFLLEAVTDTIYINTDLITDSDLLIGRLVRFADLTTATILTAVEESPNVFKLTLSQTITIAQAGALEIKVAFSSFSNLKYYDTLMGLLISQSTAGLIVTHRCDIESDATTGDIQYSNVEDTVSYYVGLQQGVFNTQLSLNDAVYHTLDFEGRQKDSTDDILLGAV